MKKLLFLVFFGQLFINTIGQTIVGTNPTLRNAVLEEITGIN
jgi:hypothetical protein